MRLSPSPLFTPILNRGFWTFPVLVGKTYYARRLNFMVVIVFAANSGIFFTELTVLKNVYITRIRGSFQQFFKIVISAELACTMQNTETARSFQFRMYTPYSQYVFSRMSWVFRSTRTATLSVEVQNNSTNAFVQTKKENSCWNSPSMKIIWVAGG